jgi:capsular polysaccharide transport system ATP-binding protein
MIELKNVTKYYKTNNKNKYVLKNVDLTIPGGVNVAILGVNGSGKSTLLKMLGGIDFPNSGVIESDKTFSWVMGIAKGLQPSMTGRQNVKLICRLYGKTHEEMSKICSYVKEFSELNDFFDMPIKVYSSGMKSKLAFSTSLAFDFDYLIIDEILSVGDAHFKKKSKDALKSKMQNCNILMVSHAMNAIKELCDVGIVLDNKGGVNYYDTVEAAIESYNNYNKVKNK